MSYQLYRNTTLGHTLQESLDELIQVDNCQYNVCTQDQYYFRILVWSNHTPISL